jgi:hypothetical protein
MTKKIVSVITLTIVWFLVSIYIYSAAFGETTRVKLSAQVSKDNEFQVFYTTTEVNEFREDRFVNARAKAGADFEKIYFQVNRKDIETMRIDFGMNPGEVLVKDVTIELALKKVKLSSEQIKNIFTGIGEDVEKIELRDNILYVYSSKPDPLIYSNDIGNILRKQPYDYTKLALMLLFSIVFAGASIRVYNKLINRGISPRRWGFAALFIVIVFLPSTVNMLGIESGVSTEQRTLAKKPVFRLNRDIINLYPREYETYINDNFGLKSFLVWLNSYIDVKVLKSSPIDRVALGKEGWLYATKEGKLNMIDIYRGMIFFSDEELLRIKNNLVEQNEWLKERDIPFVLLIAPNKETVYPEYLPDSIKKVQEKGRLDQLISYLKANTNINIIDGREVLLNNKGVGRLYYKTDSHWNELGAYYGHKAIMDQVGKSFPKLKSTELNDYNIVTEVKSEGGDLARMLSLPKNFNEENILLKPKKPSRAKVVNHPYVLNQGLVTEVKDETLPRMLMYRDSFTINMQPFLSEYFSTAVYQWNHSFDPELVRETKPDIVIHEVVERYIHELLAENPKEMKR